MNGLRPSEASHLTLVGDPAAPDPAKPDAHTPLRGQSGWATNPTVTRDAVVVRYRGPGRYVLGVEATERATLSLTGELGESAPAVPMAMLVTLRTRLRHRLLRIAGRHSDGTPADPRGERSLSAL